MSCQTQISFSFPQSLCKLQVKIRPALPWFEIKLLQQVHIHLFSQRVGAALVQDVLRVLQKVMPAENVLLIRSKPRRIHPFLYLHLCPAGLLAFVNLKKIAKIPALIISAQRKQPTDPGPCLMNAAASILI